MECFGDDIFLHHDWKVEFASIKEEPRSGGVFSLMHFVCKVFIVVAYGAKDLDFFGGFDGFREVEFRLMI